MSKKDHLSDILDQMLEDAAEQDPKRRFYRLADDKLLTLISNLGEYFVHKINRGTDEEGSIDSLITVVYKDGRNTD